MNFLSTRPPNEFSSVVSTFICPYKQLVPSSGQYLSHLFCKKCRIRFVNYCYKSSSTNNCDANLSLLFQLGQHHYDVASLLPRHQPEIVYGRFFGSLGCNELLNFKETLKRFIRINARLCSTRMKEMRSYLLNIILIIGILLF